MKAMNMSHGERKTLSRSTEKNGQKRNSVFLWQQTPAANDADLRKTA
ncbi:MAG TPA: hypothetical protein PLU47_15830 [Azonexus sp.]|nr:hypothetical protein [Azonexus sp.]